MSIIVLLIAVSTYIVFSNTESSEADSACYSGECGESAFYIFNPSSGSFVINGSGEIYEYGDNPAPWNSFREDIKKVVIKGSINSIGVSWFENCSSLTSVTLSDSITSIEDFAFDTCTSLTSITLPDSLTYIGDYAFGDCSSLTSISIPCNVSNIGSNAFDNCYSLTSVSVPRSVTSLGSLAPFQGTFYEWDGKTELGQTVENLAGFTFENIDGKWIKQSLYPQIELPEDSGVCGDNVVYDFYAFSGKLIIGGSGPMYDYSSRVTPWDSYKNQIKFVFIEDSVNFIGQYAFYRCPSIVSVDIADTVGAIGCSAFRECSSLKAVFLPDSVFAIDEYAFDGCGSLAIISFPIQDVYLGKSAFNGNFCDADGETILNVQGLAGSTFKNIGGKWIKQSPYSIDSVFDDASGTLIINGSGLLKVMQDETPWEAYKESIRSVIICGEITYIGDYAFENCINLTSIQIPDSVKGIGVRAFDGCTCLLSVTLPESVKFIGSNAFNGCTRLSSVTFGNNVENICAHAFDNCISLTSIVLPDSIKSLGEVRSEVASV